MLKQKMNKSLHQFHPYLLSHGMYSKVNLLLYPQLQPRQQVYPLVQRQQLQIEYALWTTTQPLLRSMYQRSAEPTLPRTPTQAPQGLLVLRYWPLLEMYQVQSEFWPIVKIWLDPGLVAQSKVKQLPLLVRQQLVPQILMPKPQILLQLLQHVPPMLWMQVHALLVLQKRLLPDDPEVQLEAEADREVSEPVDVDIMAIFAIPLQEELIGALSEVLVSMAMFELGGELGFEESLGPEGLTKLGIAVIEGIASTAAFIIEASMVIVESITMRAESIGIAAGMTT